MANDMIETALASALEELETVKKGSEEQKELLHELLEKIDGLEKRLIDQKPVPLPRLNTAPIETAIVKGIIRLQQTVEAQPKTVIHQRRILLFPEYNAQEYFKTVIARLSLAVITVIITTFLFLLCEQFITDWYAVHSQEKQLNEYKQYFQYLESKDKKKVKQTSKTK